MFQLTYLLQFCFLSDRMRPVLSANLPDWSNIPQFAPVLSCWLEVVCRDAQHSNPALYDVIKGSTTLLVLHSLLTLLFYPLTNVWKVK